MQKRDGIWEIHPHLDDRRNNLRQPLRQQQAPARQFCDREAGAVPRSVALYWAEQLRNGTHDLVRKVRRQTSGDATDALGGGPSDNSVLRQGFRVRNQEFEIQVFWV